MISVGYSFKRNPYLLAFDPQFIVGVDGEVGLCYEHSPAEGQPVAVMMDFIVRHM